MGDTVRVSPLVRSESSAMSLLQVSPQIGAHARVTMTEMTKPALYVGRTRVVERQRAALVALLFASAVVWALLVFVPHFPIWLLAIPLALGLVMQGVAVRIYVGEDGVLVKWFGSRFVAYRDLVDVRLDGRDVVIRTKDGRSLILPVGAPVPISDAERRRTKDLLLLLSSRIFRAEEPEGAGDFERRLQRSGRDAKAWSDELASLSNGSAYRQVAASPEILWRVLENTSAPEDARVGAALALRPSLDEESRRRVRVAAETSASPRVSVALDTIASPTAEETEIIDALDKFGPRRR
jgi:hypothetical protein